MLTQTGDLPAKTVVTDPRAVTECPMVSRQNHIHLGFHAGKNWNVQSSNTSSMYYHGYTHAKRRSLQFHSTKHNPQSAAPPGAAPNKVQPLTDKSA